MQSSFRTWMLPEGVVESLPREAQKLNTLEQIALTTFSRWGYQPLRPPIMEYADTFLGGNNTDNLSEQTIQFKDQKSGKQLGFRSDFTPQIARMDAHYLKTDNVSRYTYAGEAVRSYPAGHGSARNPSVIGAELLGSASPQADIEIVSLLIDYLDNIQLSHYIIELGNVDIVIELLRAFGIADAHYSLFFDALAKKDCEKLAKLGKQNSISEAEILLLQALTRQYGGAEIIDSGLEQFAAYPSVVSEIQRLQDTLENLKKLHPHIGFHIDFSDVHGYGYHNGLIFSAYIDGVWQAIARGGRYDSFGNHFDGKTDVRPSIGFSCSLNLIATRFQLPNDDRKVIICTLDPTDDIKLMQYIQTLRQQGHTVIMQFDDDIAPGQTATHHVIHVGEHKQDGFALQAVETA